MLHSMVRGGANAMNAQFTYDHTGLRVKKSVNGVDTLYTLNGNKITHIRKGTNGASGTDAVQMHFFYDAQGRPMMVRYNGSDYAYLHNLQGDIVSIIDMSGTAVVEYGYDAWGKPISTEGSMAGTLGYDNPFRYRGYVWDEETGLYYLRSRYYDPAWGRFVNADVVLGKQGVVLSHNPFTYCNNNPANRCDPSGLISDLISGSPFEWIESPWYYSDVSNPSQDEMIGMNNGLKADGVTPKRTATGGEGVLYVPALNASLIVTWGSIGEHHLDIWPQSEGRESIASHFGFTTEVPGTMEEWKLNRAWEPVEAYLKFHGTIVAGSVNLMLHSGSSNKAVLNVVSGNLCFYTYDSRTSNRVIKPLIQRHRNVATKAYEFAMSMQYKDWIVKDR